MNRFTKTEQIFLHLYRSALWADVLTANENRATHEANNEPTNAALHEANLLAETSLDETTWKEVTEVAVTQTCQGLLVDALAKLPADCRPPKEIYFSLLNVVARTESINRQMNKLVGSLFPMLKRKGIKAWLLKGQGIARCYPQPLHRMAGDIDVFIPDTQEYERVVHMFENKLPGMPHDPHLHRSFLADGILIELHAKINAHINAHIKKAFPAWLHEQMAGKSEDWNGVPLPPVGFNAVYVFVHLVAHYVGGGIGLRQLSDWMRFLYTHREGTADAIDHRQVERDVERLGIRHLWQVFACMAVTYLGCPAEVMPLYDARYRRDAAKVLRVIFDEGNFGHHDAAMKYRPKGFVAGKFYSFLVQSRRMAWNFCIFPRETLYCFPDMVKGGLERVWHKY